MSVIELPSPRQAYLRRAVSTAYYALFHLLISEATSNYRREELRSEFARVFEHGKMRNTAERIGAFFKKRPPPNEKVAAHLRKVAAVFVRVQQKREEADYDTGKEWTQTEVEYQMLGVEDAFESWKAIREEPVAQAYLMALLARKRLPE